MGPQDAENDDGETTVSRRTTLKGSLTALGAAGLGGLAGDTAAAGESETGVQQSNGSCADGEELPATEVTLPDGVTPVSQLTPLDDVPGPLQVGNEEPIESAEDWREQRRPRLKELFRKYVYGYAHPAPKRTFEVEEADGLVLNRTAKLKRVTIRFPELPDEAPTVRLDLFVPVRNQRPNPVIFGLNSFGNHVVADVPSLALPAPSRESEGSDGPFFPRGALTDYWQVRETIDRGYAFATANIADFDPEGLGKGLPEYSWEHRGDYPGALRGGTLASWAWGISRCVDYLVEDCDVRTFEIAAFGHSRAGKATLLAGATDERIALTIPHQSGTGGVALNRHEPTSSTGETVENIATTFPEWFNDYYPMFATDVSRFPIDQHHLVGLVAPRAVLATESTPEQDEWTNPDAARRSIELASDVWELLGGESISRDDVSQEGGSIPDDAPPVFHHRRDVGHRMTSGYWEAIYDFADQHLRRDSSSQGD